MDALPSDECPPSACRTEDDAFEPSATRTYQPAQLVGLWVFWGFSVALSVLCFAVFYGEIDPSSRTISRPLYTAEGSDFLEVLMAFVRWDHFLDTRRLLVFVFCLTMSGVVAWFRRLDGLAVLFAATLASMAAAPINGYLIWGVPQVLRASPWVCVFLASYTLLLAASLGLIALFPNGRLMPGLRWFVVPLWATGAVIVSLTWPYISNNRFPVLAAVGTIGFLLLLTVVWRYRHHANTLERLQLKWFVLAVSAFMLTQLPAVFLVRPYIYSSSAPVAVLASLSFEGLLFMSVVLLVSVFMIAVVRHKLWNVDVVINRSLVYGGLFLALLLVLGSAFVVFGLVFQALRGTQGQLWALLLGAVVVALAFKPILSRLKRLVDSKLYGIRVNYDALPRAHDTSGTPPGHSTSTDRDPRSTFGDYTALSPIGRGGMGRVYRATHTPSGDTVAIKVLREHLCGGDEIEKRFLREAEIATRLSHPNIVRMRGKGVLAGVPYLEMELVEGTDLASLLRAGGKLSMADTLPILRGVASALDHAHAEGIVHRDVKPSNILLAAPGHRPVLTDFGIAWLDAPTTRLTREGAVLGTLDYISPEQIHGEEEISGCADVYALGVTAFEMITGARPFAENRAVRLAMAHLMRPPPDPRTLVPELPRPVAQALGRALSKHPLDRFSTPGEFVAALTP